MDNIKFINIGYGNLVAANRVIAIISPESAPIKRIVQDAKEKGNVIDATYGRKTRGVIIMDSGHVVLSSMMPETIGSRLGGTKEIAAEREGKEKNE